MSERSWGSPHDPQQGADLTRRFVGGVNDRDVIEMRPYRCFSTEASR